jgi:hypothetical protein
MRKPGFVHFCPATTQEQGAGSAELEKPTFLDGPLTDTAGIAAAWAAGAALGRVHAHAAVRGIPFRVVVAAIPVAPVEATGFHDARAVEAAQGAGSGLQDLHAHLVLLAAGFSGSHKKIAEPAGCCQSHLR